MSDTSSVIVAAPHKLSLTGKVLAPHPSAIRQNRRAVLGQTPPMSDKVISGLMHRNKFVIFATCCRD
jgi:hypothetical protein